MKKLLISALAVGMLTACSQDETVEMQTPNAIAFAGAFVENVTRAAADPSITTASIENFSVWGYVKNDNGTGQLFDDVTVTKAGDAWTYSPLQYWTPSNEYHFFALTTNTDTDYKGQVKDQDLAESGIGEIEFTITDGNEDLLYATATTSTGPSITTAPAPVKFVFDHLLSKVKFTFKNGFATGYSTIKVTDIKMTVPAVGTIALNEQGTYEWNTAGETAEISEDNDGSITLGYGDIEKGNSIAESAMGESDNERLVIPATQSYNVTFDVELFQDGVSVYTVDDQLVTIENYELKPGYAYNFIATLDPTNIGGDGLYPIEFEVEVEDWVEGNGLGILGHKDVATEEELHAAIAEGAVINLVEDIELNNPVVVKDENANVVLNLNGKSLKCATSDVLVCQAGTLTINGEGLVYGSEDNSSSSCAVWALGTGKVIINGGTYKVGDDESGRAENNWRNDCIYAKENATITINGGEFMYTGENPLGYTFLLNCKDADYKAGKCKIVVAGGKFHNFNPGASNGENPVASYLAEGCTSTETAENVWTVK